MSVAIDPHKMGMSTIPSGGLLYRDESHMKSLEISARYLTSQVQSSLAGTRTGASAAATYAVMRHLGMDGYRRIVSTCMDNTMLLRDSLVDMGLELALEPVMNIVTVKLPDAQSTRKKLCDMGWYVSTTSGRKPADGRHAPRHAPRHRVFHLRFKKVRVSSLLPKYNYISST